jgi:peptidoglycan/xylan/chitin deacetylase (PgdA/CDA1 family)
VFCISLDFELAWGLNISDVKGPYKNNLIGAKNAALKINELFNKYGIKATWGVVGSIYTERPEMLEQFYKELKYTNMDLSPLNILNYKSQCSEDIFSAKDVIDIINSSGEHEIASHTFSHLYLLEKGISDKELKQDIETFDKIVDIETSSIIFPRNQVNESQLDLLSENFRVYRGNLNHWAYQPKTSNQISIFARCFRLLDSILPISRMSCSFSKDKRQSIINVPGTCFLRPISNRSSIISRLKLTRLKRAMTCAAKNGELFHLWWHPHNFGINTQANISYLEDILIHYKKLTKQYTFPNYTMREIGELCD